MIILMISKDKVKANGIMILLLKIILENLETGLMQE